MPQMQQKDRARLGSCSQHLHQEPPLLLSYSFSPLLFIYSFIYLFIIFGFFFVFVLFLFCFCCCLLLFVVCCCLLLFVVVCCCLLLLFCRFFFFFFLLLLLLLFVVDVDVVLFLVKKGGHTKWETFFQLMGVEARDKNKYPKAIWNVSAESHWS